MGGVREDVPLESYCFCWLSLSGQPASMREALAFPRLIGLWGRAWEPRSAQEEAYPFL